MWKEAMKNSEMRFISLQGLGSYSEIQSLQKKLIQLRWEDQIPDTFLFLEHQPVITKGRGLQRAPSGISSTILPGAGNRHMPLPLNLPKGITLVQTERGGDLTYHGPGQLVLYPICKLDGRGFGARRDVSGFIRNLEKIMIDELQNFGLQGEAREGATGVWIGHEKIASIGVAVRKWVTYHGIAINLVNDLSPFSHFSPCGFSSEVMIRLKDLKPEWANDVGANWRVDFEKRLMRQILKVASVHDKESFHLEHLKLDEVISV
jgi:lipoyl(octanoyl) transferase